MEPYYASWPDISFLVATGGAAPRRTAKRTRTLRATVGMSPALEGSLTQEKSDDPPSFHNPTAALGQLSAAILKLKADLVNPSDPTLAPGDWFEIVAPSDFGILHRDDYRDGQEVAAWFLEVPNQKLGLAFWIVMTGTPCHLRERWTTENTRNRSGSGTSSAFDMLTAVANGQSVTDKCEPARVFAAVAGLRGMVGATHQIRTIAEVKHVIRNESTGYSLQDESGNRLPVVTIIMASPLFVERNRETSEAQIDPADSIDSGRRSLFRRRSQK